MSKINKNKLEKHPNTIGEFWHSNTGQLLLTVPKNLLKITILTVLGSFAIMIYKIKTDNTIWDEDIEEMLMDPKN